MSVKAEVSGTIFVIHVDYCYLVPGYSRLDRQAG